MTIIKAQTPYIKYVIILAKNGHHCVASADQAELRQVTKKMGEQGWKVKDLRVASSEEEFLDLLLQLNDGEEAK